MRHLAATAVALSLIALGPGAIGPLEAEDETPRLLRLADPGEEAAGDGPVILRGSATGPRTAATAGATAPRWQVAGGRRLWLVDPVAQEFRVCGLFDTTDVDVRQVRCWTRPIGRYARTFGPTFQP